MRRSAALVIALGMLFMASFANASITVDGYMSDWGVTPGAYGASDWVPDSGIIYNEEDQNTNYLNPGYGGQKFDAEAIYGMESGNFLYLAIVTGHPAFGWSGHTPGDIYINFGSVVYGLKTTGADAGKLYSSPLWNTGPYAWGGITTMQDGSGTYLGLTDFVYLNTYVGAGDSNDHWVMEMEMDKSFFGTDWMNGGTISWTETCGNDVIGLDIPRSHTPEPATMSLLGLGLAGLLKFRKKRV